MARSDVELLNWWLSQGAASPCSLCLPCCSISSFLFLPGAFIFVGKPSAGRAGNKKMKVVEGISTPLPALLPPALLPAPPQPGMPGDAGAASSTHTLRGGWGGTLLPGQVAGKWGGHQHDPAPTHAESCGRHLGTAGSEGDRRALVPPERQQEFMPQFPCGKGHGGEGALHSPGCRHELYVCVILRDWAHHQSREKGESRSTST